MTSSLKAVSAGFGLGITLLLSFAAVASAGPKEDVAAATSTWASALGEDDPDKVLPLYSDDAVLWGTLSPKIRHCGTISCPPSRFFRASRLRSAIS